MCRDVFYLIHDRSPGCQRSVSVITTEELVLSGVFYTHDKLHFVLVLTSKRWKRKSEAAEEMAAIR